jgi:hypothetical protein
MHIILSVPLPSSQCLWISDIKLRVKHVWGYVTTWAGNLTEKKVLCVQYDLCYSAFGSIVCWDFFSSSLLPFGSLLLLCSIGLISQFLDYLQTVGLFGRVISSSQGLYLNTGQYTHQTSMPWVGFEHTIPVSERAKTVHALDRSATVTGMLGIESDNSE